MTERVIIHDVFTKEIRERIKLEANSEARQYMEDLENIAAAAEMLMQANEDMARARVKIGSYLRRVNFLK